MLAGEGAGDRPRTGFLGRREERAKGTQRGHAPAGRAPRLGPGQSWKPGIRGQEIEARGEVVGSAPSAPRGYGPRLRPWKSRRFFCGRCQMTAANLRSFEKCANPSVRMGALEKYMFFERHL